MRRQHQSLFAPGSGFDSKAEFFEPLPNESSDPAFAMVDAHGNVGRWSEKASNEAQICLDRLAIVLTIDVTDAILAARPCDRHARHAKVAAAVERGTSLQAFVACDDNTLRVGQPRQLDHGVDGLFGSLCVN